MEDKERFLKIMKKSTKGIDSYHHEQERDAINGFSIPSYNDWLFLRKYQMKSDGSTKMYAEEIKRYLNSTSLESLKVSDLDQSVSIIEPSGDGAYVLVENNQKTGSKIFYSYYNIRSNYIATVIKVFKTPPITKTECWRDINTKINH